MSEKIQLENAPLDYIIFDADSRIVSSSFKQRGVDDLYMSLMRSMKRGDRMLLDKFCSAKYSEEFPEFEILRSVRFFDNSYIFLEKDMISGRSYTVGFFGTAITAFIPLMSPDTRLYQTTSGRSIYEIMLALAESERHVCKSCVTPEALTLYEKAPLLFDELLSLRHNVKNCELMNYIGTAVRHITESSMFGRVKLSLSEIGASHESDIYPIYTASLVYLLTSTVQLLSYMSVNREVEISLKYHEDGVIMEISSLCDPLLKFSSNSSSFSDIGRLFPDLRYAAGVVNVLGEGLGFFPTLRHSSGRLSIAMKVTGSRLRESEFKYSDPYSSISALISEACNFFEKTAKQKAGEKSSGNK